MDLDGQTVVVSDPERRLFGETGPTKAQLLTYYTNVAERIVPFVRGRAVSTVLLPGDSTPELRFMRSAPPGCLGRFATSRLTCLSSLRIERYLTVFDRETLLALVQHGCFAFHPWISKVRAPLQPTQMVFNLDPEAIAFREVRNAALLLRHLLGHVGLRAWVKTSGRQGLHVLVPVTGNATFEDTRYAANIIVNRAIAADPALFSRDSRRARRRGKILLDTSRNQRGETLIAPYAVATSGIPSVPLEWSELERPMYPGDFDMDRAAARQDLEDQSALLAAEQSLEPLLRRRRRVPDAARATHGWEDLASAESAAPRDNARRLRERSRQLQVDAQPAKIDSANALSHAQKVYEERRHIAGA
jgi:bifunctional non-homologous end joining protein LigD